MSALSPKNPAMRTVALSYTCDVNFDTIAEYMALETDEDYSKPKKVRDFVKSFLYSFGEHGLYTAVFNATGKSIYD
tara:strand:- start:373 stop:600 length:228 start_codon:yes stop_codon:yes gene_type:complete